MFTLFMGFCGVPVRFGGLVVVRGSFVNRVGHLWCLVLLSTQMAFSAFAKAGDGGDVIGNAITLNTGLCTTAWEITSALEAPPIGRRRPVQVQNLHRVKGAFCLVNEPTPKESGVVPWPKSCRDGCSALYARAQSLSRDTPSQRAFAFERPQPGH
jgi:hypothetical protein